MYLKRILYSNVGKVFISILLGLGLATLFRKVCNNRNCLVFKAPELGKIKNQVFKFEGKCYKFSESIERCDKGKKIIPFA